MKTSTVKLLMHGDLEGARDELLVAKRWSQAATISGVIGAAFGALLSTLQVKPDLIPQATPAIMGVVTCALITVNMGQYMATLWQIELMNTQIAESSKIASSTEVNS
jgi:hypothetical protein